MTEGYFSFHPADRKMSLPTIKGGNLHTGGFFSQPFVLHIKILWFKHPHLASVRRSASLKYEGKGSHLS